MLLTLTTTDVPATDLGFLLHKHPEKHQIFELTVGTAHVFYPEATAERCTAALVLDVDPVALVRGRQGRNGAGGGIDQYVNDRPMRPLPSSASPCAGCSPRRYLAGRSIGRSSRRERFL